MISDVFLGICQILGGGDSLWEGQVVGEGFSYSIQFISHWTILTESKHFLLTVHTEVPEHHKLDTDLAATPLCPTRLLCQPEHVIKEQFCITLNYGATSWGILNLLGCGRHTPTLKTFKSSHEDHKKPWL